MKRILLLFVMLICMSGFSQSNKQKIQSQLNTEMKKFGLTTKDIADWVVESEVTSETTKINNYYIVQRYQGIEIFNAQSNVSMKNGKIINISNNFKKNVAQKVNETTPALSALEAIENAYSRLGINNSTSFSIVETINDKSFKLSDGIQEDLISAKLVYQSTKDDKLKLAWAFQFYSPDGKHLWDLRIDALNGVLLEKNDLTINCNFGYVKQTRYPANYPFNFNESTVSKTVTSPVGVNAGSYRVIPYNYESPNHSPFQLITSPSNTIASPNGWHNSNSLSGTNSALIYSYTRGNNVFAQEDANGNNGTGISPNGGAALNFDFAYGGQTSQPTDYSSASTTNLFYMVNIMHDVWYQYGFNEASGNFQKDNLGRGGITSFIGDDVLADSQDGYSQATATLNNANFSTPNDGSRPRMQMYLWNDGAPPTNFITVNSPASIAGPKIATSNVFEGTDRIPVPVSPNGITSDLVLYKNNPTPPGYNSACQVPLNAAELNGKIALIKRGGCFFNLKVKNAQDAGARAVIVMDTIPNNPTRLSMSSTGVVGITIPAVFVTKEIGDAFIAEMVNGSVNIKLEVPPGLYLYADSSFDNGIIAHEFAHGISNRLTGGPSNTSCLTTPEQMGEGWSDWFALMMQLKTGDSGETAKGIATYAINEATTGGGIRNHPYSTNMTINPLTFADTNGKSFIDPEDSIEKVWVHAVGEIWAATLWDLTWAYIGKYGFSSNIYTGTGGNNKAMQLVIDAMKLQPCNPSFIQARDAIIAADQATTGGQDYCMIWKVFARRGLGVNASSGDNSGDRTNIAAINDQVEDFTEPSAGANCTLLSVNQFINNDKISVYPNPAPRGQLNIHINDFVGKINIQVADLNGRIVYRLNDSNFNIEKAINLNSLQKGIYILKVTNETINYTEKIIIK
ncbi:T9SS type A sorting domain-containing protein [Flavobacterium franklandianum]|uniref:T9SS-dependent M36 family metallopeptidase n=1 Tax=Flavobacterium franklandianum TaxID=2594430 RepID=UPI00117BAFBF|nr:T9SS-dependent M36 family metallopeptidase [Flavobacterium franklandianum]TRX24940.1 T9SS type A sorting domain-containing protein [Flavobacterium franklandianum]